MKKVLKSGHYESPLGYDNVVWFVDKVIKLENILFFYSQSTNKDLIKTEKDEKHYRDNNIYRLYEEGIVFDEDRYHCH